MTEVEQEVENWQNLKEKTSNDSFINSYTKTFSKKEKDHDKLRWLSNNEMLNSFKVAEKIADFSRVNTWLDVACGTGDFFKYILKLNKYNIERCIGIDAVEHFIDVSIEKNKELNNSNIEFFVENLYNLTPDKHGLFDLVSLSGTLQTLSLDKVDLAVQTLVNLVKPGGQIWINTLNYDYDNSNERKFKSWNKYKSIELKALLDKYGFISEANCYNIKSDIVEKSQGFYVYVYGPNKNNGV